MGDVTFSILSGYDNTITSIAFSPALVQVTQPRFAPLQRLHLAESGQVWVYQLSSNVELELPIDFLDIPTADETTPAVTAGYDTLYNWLASTTQWSRLPWTLTDADGDSYAVRYMGGIESFREAIGRSQKMDRWTGTILVRRVIT